MFELACKFNNKIRIKKVAKKIFITSYPPIDWFSETSVSIV